MTELENYQRILDIHVVKDGERVQASWIRYDRVNTGKVIGCSSIEDGNNYLICEVSDDNEKNFGWDWDYYKNKYSPNVKTNGKYWWIGNIIKEEK